MAENERDIVLPKRVEFQPIIGYRDFARVPTVVAKQTSVLLDLVHSGTLPDTTQAKDYLKSFTFDYLDQAVEGSAPLYDQLSELENPIDLEVRETAGHAFVAFGAMPDMVKSRYLHKGYSRRGMLKSPETREEFLKRITELKRGVSKVVHGGYDPYVVFEAQPSMLRTFNFFKVGSEIPVRLPDSDKIKDQIEREKFNDFLGGININL